MTPPTELQAPAAGSAICGHTNWPGEIDGPTDAELALIELEADMNGGRGMTGAVALEVENEVTMPGAAEALFRVRVRFGDRLATGSLVASAPELEALQQGARLVMGEGAGS